jgi:hypothetical protein
MIFFKFYKVLDEIQGYYGLAHCSVRMSDLELYENLLWEL